MCASVLFRCLESFAWRVDRLPENMCKHFLVILMNCTSDKMAIKFYKWAGTFLSYISCARSGKFARQSRRQIFTFVVAIIYRLFRRS